MKKVVFLIIILSFLPCCKSGENMIAEDSPKEENVLKMETDQFGNEEEGLEIIIQEENLIVNNENNQILQEGYFVIMGSYKIYENAVKFQNQLTKEGFNSQILRNENGLYRVSVFSYANLAEAREKIYFIRKNYPKYYDVWLLKRIT